MAYFKILPYFQKILNFFNFNKFRPETWFAFNNKATRNYRPRYFYSRRRNVGGDGARRINGINGDDCTSGIPLRGRSTIHVPRAKASPVIPRSCLLGSSFRRASDNAARVPRRDTLYRVLPPPLPSPRNRSTSTETKCIKFGRGR